MPRHLKEYIYTQQRVDRRKVSGHVFPYQLGIEPWDSIMWEWLCKEKLKPGFVHSVHLSFSLIKCREAMLMKLLSFDWL